MLIEDYIVLLNNLKEQYPDVEFACRSTSNLHTQVIGRSRVVNVYPTTGTVNAAPVKNRFGSYSAKHMNVERAFERGVTVARFGY